MSEIEIGDVVRLNGDVGGQRMTVTHQAYTGCTCVWFEGAQLRRDTFPAACLTKILPLTKPVGLDSHRAAEDEALMRREGA